MTTQQLTVLSGNSAIHLSEILSHLGSQGVDLRAHCLVDNGDGNCKLRMIVSDSDKAVGILHSNKLATVINDVVMVEADDTPGGLSRLLKMFENDDMQIEYTYTAASEKTDTALMVFRFSNNTRAIGILEQNGLKVL